MITKHDELPTEYQDSLIAFLHKMIKIAVRILAILMVLVIFWGVGDVVYVLYQNLINPPYMLLDITDILKTFAVFLAVLIAIEIYQNIVMYLRTDVVPIKLVEAIARKVIIIDFKDITPMYIFATSTVILALGITYYLVGKHHKERLIDERSREIKK